VGATELPVEKTLVRITLGITGAEFRGSGSNFLVAMLTVGAVASCTFTALGRGAGTRRALAGGSSFATKTGFGNGRKGWG
jgi:hypothetical protein